MAMAMTSPASPSASMQNALQAAEQLSAALAEQANRQQQQQAQAAHINGFAQTRPQQQQSSPVMFQPSPKQHTAAPSSLILNSAHYSLPPIPTAMRQLHPTMLEPHTQSIVHHNQHFYAPAPPAARTTQQHQQQQPATLNPANSRPYPFVNTSPFALLQQQQQQLPALQPVSHNSSAASSPSSTTSSAPPSNTSSPTSSPPPPTNNVLNLFDLLEHMTANITRIRAPTLSAQLGQQLKGLREQMLQYRTRHEQGEDMNRQAHLVYRSMRQFDEQITKHLTAQDEHDRLLSLVNFKSHTAAAAAGGRAIDHVLKPIPTTLLQQQHYSPPPHSPQQPNGISLQHMHTNGHGAVAAVEVETEKAREEDGEKESRKEKKRRRKENRDRSTEEDEERRARKKKRRDTEDTEARERRKRKKEKRKAREARREAAQEKERQKEKARRKKHKASKHQQNGHLSSSSSSSSSSSAASDSSDESSDNESSGRKSAGKGKRKHNDKEQTVQALIATLHGKQGEKKKSKKVGKDGRRLQQTTEHDTTPIATLVTTATPLALAAITTSYRPPAFNLIDFADAFRHLPTPPAMPAPFPRPAATTTGQLVCPPLRQAVQLPQRVDDDGVVRERGVLLERFGFSPAAVRAVMQRAVPADGECSEEAVQLVTQSVCQFIAFITDEAEADIQMAAEDDSKQPSHPSQAVVEQLDEDELPLSLSLRPPPLENEQGEQSKAESIEQPPLTSVALGRQQQQQRRDNE